MIPFIQNWLVYFRANGEIVSNRRSRSMPLLFCIWLRQEGLWRNCSLWAHRHQLLAKFEMEKKNRCVHCGCRLEPGGDLQSCKPCALRLSFEAASSSTSEVKKDQVRGGWLRPPFATTQKSPESPAQHLFYGSSPNGKNNFSWLTSDYNSSKISLREYYHSDAKGTH